MPSALELFSAVIRLRTDAIPTLLPVSGGGSCDANVSQHGVAQKLSGITHVTVVMFVVASALLAGGTTLVLGYPATATLTTGLSARAGVLELAALTSAVLLIAAARLALLHAELRVHADAGRPLQPAWLETGAAVRCGSMKFSG